jgi:hypothetical protein
MDAQQHLFYGLGQIAYAVAIADGKVQPEEEEKLQQMVNDGLQKLGSDASYTEIIFLLNERDKSHDGEFLYTEGIRNIDLGKHHMTGAMKDQFMALLEEIALSYKAVEPGEAALLGRFKADVARF